MAAMKSTSAVLLFFLTGSPIKFLNIARASISITDMYT